MNIVNVTPADRRRLEICYEILTEYQTELSATVNAIKRLQEPHAVERERVARETAHAICARYHLRELEILRGEDGPAGETPTHLRTVSLPADPPSLPNAVAETSGIPVTQPPEN